MKKLIATVFASLLAVVGLVTVSGGSGANAASPYPNPTATANAPVPCKIVIAGGKGRGSFSVQSTVSPNGGLVQIKLHRVHTPGTKKLKITVPSYSQTIPKVLTKGTWHGTMIYLPAAGSAVSYCGVVFYNLHVK